MEKKKKVKKWIVKEISIPEYGAAVPLRFDPEDGLFWFEYPDDKSYYGTRAAQYASCDRGTLIDGIYEVVKAFHHKEWTKHIAVKEKDTSSSREQGTPYVGFAMLARFERSVVELRVPRRSGQNTDFYNVKEHHLAHREQDNDFLWRTVKNTNCRPFPDEEYLHPGNMSWGFSIRDAVVLDYSDELWERFLHLFHACSSMHATLNKLMHGTPEEVAARVIETIGPGAPLLGDGK